MGSDLPSWPLDYAHYGYFAARQPWSQSVSWLGDPGSFIVGTLDFFLLFFIEKGGVLGFGNFPWVVLTMVMGDGEVLLGLGLGIGLELVEWAFGGVRSGDITSWEAGWV